MPLLRPVSGINEPYQGSPDLHRFVPVGAAEGPSDDRQRRSADDPSTRSAHAAYQRQAGSPPAAKPATVAQDLMTVPVVTLASDRTVLEAWLAMRRGGFRHIPVVSVDGALVGMLSDKDLLQRVPELILSGNDAQARQLRLAQVMSGRVVSAVAATEIRQIARLMLDERIHALPIVDSQRRPIGMLTVRDLLRGLAHHTPLELWT